MELLRVVVFKLDEKREDEKVFDQTGSSVVVGVSQKEGTSVYAEGSNVEVSYCLSCIKADETDRLLDARKEG